MSTFAIPYGHNALSLTLPDDRFVDLIAPADVPPASAPEAVVRAALVQPVGGVSLDDWRGVKSAAIAVNDKTRPVPHDVLLPPLLEQLAALGLAPDAITLLIATGTHPPMTPDEFADILPPDVLDRYPVISHDCDAEADLVSLGATERGTPVLVNRHFMAADLRIVIGNIEPHQFMGFSGGVKSAAIGLAGRDTVNHNHAMMTHRDSRLGVYTGNPARQDVEEIGRMIGVHFALNAVLNRHKRLVHAVAGEPRAVMSAGIPLAQAIVQVPVMAPYDVVIASPGGHPKDINIYQAQKALAHAALVACPHGTIIIAAACPEGTGSRGYETWMLDGGFQAHYEVVERFRTEGFRVGPHKAFQISRDAMRAQLMWVSDLPEALARRLLLNPAHSLEAAVAMALDDLPPDSRIAVMPQANATIPLLGNQRPTLAI